MDVPGFIGKNAAGFFSALRPWLTIPAIGAELTASR
jgi:hypothetical protein